MSTTSSNGLLAGWPQFDAEQIAACQHVLASGKVNYWTGSQTKDFEREFSEFTGTKYSVALANGSLALSCCYLSLGLSQRDEVITTPRTFVATASSVALLGARPVFADVDPDSGSITASSIAPLIAEPRLFRCASWWLASRNARYNLAKSYGISVVEDCAQAHGAFIDGQSVGSFGDVSAWSFCQDKIMSTAGEGGMITTSNPEIHDTIWSFKDHGKTLKSVYQTDHKPGFRWLHERFGSNFRLTELQGAIGRIQLQRLPSWNHLRSRNASLLIDTLSDLPNLRIPLPPENITHAWYKFYAYVDPSSLKTDWSRDRILHEICLLGYPSFSGSCSEVYLEACFRNAGLSPTEELPVAHHLGQTSLMFLVHPTITAEQMTEYANAVRSVLVRACR